jgi:hypothetical protein
VQSVKDELLNRGFSATHIRQFLKNGRKLPMFMVTLPSDSASKEIFQLDSIFHIKIRVEAYKTTGPAQCFTCQGFGHSSANCGHSARCVKCGCNHLTKECTKTADQAPKCCNCGGEHTANYCRCPFYSQQVEKTQKTRRQQPQTINSEQIQNPTPAVPKSQTVCSTYADATKHQLPKIPKDTLINILTDTIAKIANSDDIKTTITLALSTMLQIIQNA